MRFDARPWVAWALIVACAWAYAGWSAWLLRFIHLTAAFAFTSIAFVSMARTNRTEGMPGSAIIAIGCAIVGAAAASALLRVANQATGLPDQRFGFDMGIATAFATTLLVPRLAQREKQRQLEREKQLAELKLKALEGQIEPHFLYNTLGNVQQLVHSNPQEAGRMLESLVRYLKATIPEVRNGQSSLGREIERVEAYLAIMGMRMGERLRYRIDVHPSLRDTAVPPLSVITLVENAVKHGLDPVPAGGTVVVSAHRTDGRVRVAVADDGAGFGDDVGTGTGLQNLRERLSTLYGDRGALDLEHRSPSGVQAILTVPAA